MRTLRLLLLVLFIPSLAVAQVKQDFSLQCADPIFGMTYTVPYWGPGVCIPPTPYDVIGQPKTGWPGGTPSCSTGGSFSCNPGDTFLGMFPASTGIGNEDTGGAATLTISAANQFIPGVILNAFVVPAGPTTPTTQKSIVLTVDGSIQLNSAVVGSFGIATVSLQRIGPNPAALCARQVMVQNSVVQQNNQPYTISCVDIPPPGVHSYRVAVQGVVSNAPIITGGNIFGTRTRLQGVQNGF
jgi:hypothetical protein